jgi:hypothetical protein
VGGQVFSLVALAAPGSVEAAVGRLQAGLFAAHGLLSAMALPPLVPLAFVPPQPRPRALLAALERSVSAPWRIGARGLAWVDGWLYLGIDSGGTWAALRAAALARCGEAAALFPAAEGFYLGCGEAGAEQRAAAGPAAPVLVFSSCDIALVDIRAAGSGPWWKEVYWEIIEALPLRGRRTT